jgi:hypothetical protein
MEQIKKTVIELKQYLERSLPLILLGAALGYAFAQHLEAQQPDTVGFATVEDMSFLIGELEDCRVHSLEDSY